MNFVQPIRDPEVVREIMDYLKKTNERNYILFVTGIYSGLRISDILRIKIGILKGTHFTVREGKTGKQRRIKITPELKRELQWYIDGRDDEEYLVQSRQKTRGGNPRPISRSMAYKVLRKVAKTFKLEEIGCHTLRKTFGYHFYVQTRNIALLMEIFNHSSEKITLRYIGINQDIMDQALTKFKI
jgi:integrase